MTRRSISICSARSWPRRGSRSPSEEYHEPYLGYDDRGCFEAALRDAGQTSDGPRLDELIARKARRYVEVAEQGCGSSPTRPRRSRPWPVVGPWRSAPGRCGPRSSTPSAADRPSRPGRGDHRGRGRAQVQARPRGLPPAPRRPARRQAGPEPAIADLQARRVPGGRGQPGRDRLGQGGRHVGRRHHPHLQRRASSGSPGPMPSSTAWRRSPPTGSPATSPRSGSDLIGRARVGRTVDRSMVRAYASLV